MPLVKLLSSTHSSADIFTAQHYRDRLQITSTAVQCLADCNTVALAAHCIPWDFFKEGWDEVHFVSKLWKHLLVARRLVVRR